MPFAFCLLNSRERGFTLLEMLISIGIFSVVIVSSVGVILAIGSAQKKTAAVQDIQDNVRFAMESMSKEIRQGSAYNPPVSSCQGDACQTIRFKNISGDLIWYCKTDNGLVLRWKGDPANPDSNLCKTEGAPLTSDDVNVKRLVFYVLGEESQEPACQPRVTISLQAESKGAPRFETTFALQTTVTQRARDREHTPCPQ